MKLIDKDSVVAEIERRIKVIPRGETDKRLKAVYGNEAFVLNDLLSFIDTLEVKEVDLEKELNNFIERQNAFVNDYRIVEYNNGDTFNHIYDLEDVAKHFYELGLKAQKGE